MKKIIRISLIIFSVILFSSIIVKGCWFYQYEYVYKPKVKFEVKKFIDDVCAGEYETISDKSMFTSKEQFIEIKSKICNDYSVEFQDWGADGGAYVIIKLSDNTAYALMVIPTKDITFSLSGRGIEYKVLTIR